MKLDCDLKNITRACDAKEHNRLQHSLDGNIDRTTLYGTSDLPWVTDTFSHTKGSSQFLIKKNIYLGKNVQRVDDTAFQLCEAAGEVHDIKKTKVINSMD